MNKLNKIKKNPKAHLKPTSHISHLTSNKGITLTSLVIYITVMFVVLATIMRVMTYFRKNMTEASDITFETEFEKLNLYLLDESRKSGNNIVEITDGIQITFSSGNKYTYNAENKTVNLNDNIKVCENVESCLFEQKTAENGKSVLALTITINETTKTSEYVMAKETDGTDEVNIEDYLWGGSLVSYYLKVGDYVDYTPDTGKYTVAAGTNGSGYTSGQSFQTETGDNALKWRILSINEETGKIELVSATAGQTLYLQGVDGYNHGVDILNDLCETLYSKTVNGKRVATGRSINVEDINAKTTYDYTTFKRTDIGYAYGQKIPLSQYSTSDRKYPNLYAQETGYAPAGVTQTGLNGSEGLKNGITENGVTTYPLTGYTDDNASTEKRDIYVTYTYYSYNGSEYTYYPDQCLDTTLGINTTPIGLINIGTSYWLASRCAGAYSYRVYFFVRCMWSGGSMGGPDLFNSRGDAYSPNCAVRPVVSLSAAELINFSVGDGSPENPWGMK